MKVLAVLNDLFLQSRVTELVSRTSGEVKFANNAEHVKKLLDTYQPELIILDLSSSEFDPFSMVQEIRSRSTAKMFGIFPHVRKDLEMKADSAGFDFVVPNSGFLAILARILTEKAGL